MTSRDHTTGPRTEQARRLVRARLRAGYDSARKAALAMGLPYETYAQHERGKRALKWTVAQKYADLYGVQRDWLMVVPGAAEPDLISGSQPMTTSARPASRRQDASDTMQTGIDRILSTDRALMVEACRKAIEYALVEMGEPTGLADTQIQRLAGFATQRVLAARAAERLGPPGDDVPLPFRAAANKD